jgi:hypothetical protein
MNTKQALAAAAIALLGSSAAFAQSSEIDLQHVGANQASTASRAAVRADVVSAQAAGTLATPSEVLAAAVPAGSNVAAAPISRAELRAALSELAVPYEVAQSAVPRASTLSREAVRAEARAHARTDVYKDKSRIGAGY